MQKRLNTEQLIAKLEAEVNKSNSMRVWARENGVTPSYVCQVLRRECLPGNKIANALGLRKIVLYERVE